MDRISVTEFHRICVEKNIPFVSFSFPGEEEINSFIFENKDVRTFYSFDEIKDEKGFVLIPFVENAEFPKLFIRFTKILGRNDIDMTFLPEPSFAKPKQSSKRFTPTPKTEFLKNVANSVAAIKSGDLQKVVLSRQLVIDEVPQNQLSGIFQKMRTQLPNAFIFFIHIPEKTIWLGASPEIFLKAKKQRIETIALAGTQKIESREIRKIIWQDKEIHEQQLVSEFIEKVLEQNVNSRYKKKVPFTSVAGNICHLKTQYSFPAAAVKNINRLIQDLHPTPAVGGFPKNKSLHFIQRTESHKRAYYGGFLGCWNTEKDFDLFVNIRSFQLVGKQIVLYSGGGITAGSIPEKEWEETCLKLKILKSLVV